jgi:ArsR family transcriptional regulator, lead/cadmium/zinc/bismuth-responsive transcriptional repressor
VHLVPPERSQRRVIEGERVCQAVAALDDPAVLRDRAHRFAVLADPTRLTLLTCIDAAGPISVSDLAVATGIAVTTVSQTLRHLRANRVVAAERDGRVMRYRVVDPEVADLLAGSRPAALRAGSGAPGRSRPAGGAPDGAVPAHH